MKYLKKFNEMLDPMGSWNPNQLDNKEDVYKDGLSPSIDYGDDYENEEEGPMSGNKLREPLDPEEEADNSDVCTECDCIPCQCTDEEYDEDLRENRGTFGYFNKMTKDELLDYQDNFDHSFENPAEHDPEYVAWKTACELKGCFERVPFDRSRKESEFPSKK